MFCHLSFEPHLVVKLSPSSLLNVACFASAPSNNAEGILHDSPVTATPTYQLTLQNAELETIQDGAFHAVPTLQASKITVRNYELLLRQLHNVHVSRQLLNLRKNKLKEIRKRTFEGLLGLKDLNVERNDIEKVEAFSFSQQQELLYLTMSENRLKELNYFTFRGLLKVKSSRKYA